MLLSNAVGFHLAALATEGRSHHTVRNAKSALRELITFLSDLNIQRVEQLSVETLRRFQGMLTTRLTPQGSRLAPGSQREHIGKLRAFCRWLYQQGWLNMDLAKDIPTPRRLRQLPKPIMNLDEVNRILMRPDIRTASGFRDRVILEVLYSTAIRREEAATLVLNDVDTGGGYLTVRNGKNGKDRVVPIGERACDLMQAFITNIRPVWPGAQRSQKLFLTRFGRGVQPSAIWNIVKKYARAAGLRKAVSTHTFRHTCATQMVRAGVPIRHLQELLGHESLETTQIYTHIAIADLKAAHRRSHPRERDRAFRHLPAPPR